MSEHGAALQTYNQELVKYLEELKIKRNQLYEIIQRKTAERQVLEKNLMLLQQKMNHLNNSLQQDTEKLDQYESTIQEAERGFRKILESSQTLLQVVQKESVKLGNSENDNSDFYYPLP